MVNFHDEQTKDTHQIVNVQGKPGEGEYDHHHDDHGVRLLRSLLLQPLLLRRATCTARPGVDPVPEASAHLDVTVGNDEEWNDELYHARGHTEHQAQLLVGPHLVTVELGPNQIDQNVRVLAVAQSRIIVEHGYARRNEFVRSVHRVDRQRRVCTGTVEFRDNGKGQRYPGNGVDEYAVGQCQSQCDQPNDHYDERTQRHVDGASPEGVDHNAVPLDGYARQREHGYVHGNT